VPAPLPSKTRDELARRLYNSAELVDWENISGPEKTEQYDRWLNHADIGGVLTEYMSEAKARVWIKDVPMKEFTRAQLGVGPFAAFVSRPRCTPASVVQAAFGADWAVVDHSIEIKPNRCRARRGTDYGLVIWGNASDLKQMVWAAVEYAVDGTTDDLRVAVVESASNPTTRTQRDRQLAIAERCGVGLHYIRPATA
jgi:hypothetical protein